MGDVDKRRCHSTAEALPASSCFALTSWSHPRNLIGTQKIRCDQHRDRDKADDDPEDLERRSELTHGGVRHQLATVPGAQAVEM